MGFKSYDDSICNAINCRSFFFLQRNKGVDFWRDSSHQCIRFTLLGCFPHKCRHYKGNINFASDLPTLTSLYFPSQCLKLHLYYSSGRLGSTYSVKMLKYIKCIIHQNNNEYRNFVMSFRDENCLFFKLFCLNDILYGLQCIAVSCRHILKYWIPLHNY